MSKLRKNRGITLVALVITIIILLILAGIAISQLTNSGLFQNVQTAKSEHENAQAREDDILKQYENAISTGEVASDRDNITISDAEYSKLLNSSNLSNYSTDEKIIGTWTNGHPLYQKTFIYNTQFTISSTAFSTSIFTNLSLNIDKIIDLKGVIGINGGSTFKLPYIFINGTTTNSVDFWYNPDDNGKIYLRGYRTPDSKTFDYAIVTLQYTKTTNNT